MADLREASSTREQIDEILDRTVEFSEDRNYPSRGKTESAAGLLTEDITAEPADGYKKVRKFMIGNPAAGMAAAFAAGLLIGFVLQLKNK